jgi:hypothetical protein
VAAALGGSWPSRLVATAAAPRDMKAPRKSVVELAALSAVSALGCVVAAGRAELLFVALFGTASTVAIIEALRRLR